MFEKVLDCCSSLRQGAHKEARCPECGNRGQKVARLTLEHLLKTERVADIEGDSYYFCKTLNCETVYFNNNGLSFRKDAVKVRIGLKETADPIPICYCFGFTAKMVYDEIQQQGHTTIPDRIKAEIRSENCACEIRNPLGHCCLGTVMQVVKQASARPVSDIKPHCCEGKATVL